MLKLGLTGGIGIGKSTVARVFESLGVPVYYADIQAKKLYNRQDIKSAVSRLFGEKVFDSRGELDKAALAAVVFADKTQLEKLNSLIHPKLEEDFRQWVKILPAETPYIVKEAAILFEAGFDKNVDKVLSISAPEEERIQRVMKRDKVSRQQVLDRISKQWTDTEREKRADYVIFNGNDRMILNEILRIHKDLSGLAELS